MKNFIFILFYLFVTIQIQAQSQTASEIAVFDALIKAKSEPNIYISNISNYALSRYLSLPELEFDSIKLIHQLSLTKTNDSLRHHFYNRLNYYFSSNSSLMRSAFYCSYNEKNYFEPICKDKYLVEFINQIKNYNSNYETMIDSIYNDTTHVILSSNLNTLPSKISNPNEFYIKLIYSDLKYPSFEKANDIFGQVIISFIMDKNLIISNIKVEKGVSKGINDESKRIIKLIGNYLPNIINTNINTELLKYRVNINFNL